MFGTKTVVKSSEYNTAISWQLFHVHLPKQKKQRTWTENIVTLKKPSRSMLPGCHNVQWVKAFDFPATILPAIREKKSWTQNSKKPHNTLKHSQITTSSSLHGSLSLLIIQPWNAVALWVAVDGRVWSIATSAATWGPLAVTLRSP